MKTYLLGLLTLVFAFAGVAGRAAAQTDYLIGPQDVLTITVFGEADLSGKYTVEQDGTFTFPLIGRVHAGGVTLRAFEQDLKAKLADGFLRNPQVTVVVDTYRSQRILVMGEVRAPGEYQLVHLHANADSREFRAANGGIVHDAGGALRDVLDYTPKKIAPRVYLIEMTEDFERGEYGFLPPSDAALGDNIPTATKLYSFSLTR